MTILTCPKCHSQQITATTRPVRMAKRPPLPTLAISFVALVLSIFLVASLGTSLFPGQGELIGGILPFGSAFLFLVAFLALWTKHGVMTTAHYYTCSQCGKKWVSIDRPATPSDK